MPPFTFRAALVLPVVFTLAASALWTASLATVNTRRIGDLGLVSALPATSFVALALICISFGLALRAETLSTPVILLHIGALVFMLYGAVGVVESEPAFNVVWRHAGVIDHIAKTGDIDTSIDAYFNWPGFFLWGALATHVAGLDSSLPWSDWSPVFFELTYLPPLVVIARAFTTDRRLSWSAIWIFYLTNWVGQDYFSPQALAYGMHLTVLAAALVYFSRRGAPSFVKWRARGARVATALRLRTASELTEPETVGDGRARASLLVAVCVVIVAAMIGSHQLTPWMTLGSLAALVVVGRCSARLLPVVTLVLLLAWLSYMASAFLGGHLKPLLGQALDINNSVSANVGSRLEGSAGHLVIVRLRLLVTAGVWLLAAIGAIRGMRQGRLAAGHGILAFAPATFVILQPYGGEMLLRVYLFSLPFAACYAAQALAPRGGAWTSWRGSVVVALSGALLLTGFLFTRYGNESVTRFTHGEVQAIEQLYEIAPRGSLLVATSPDVAWKQRRYADYRYQLLSSRFKTEESIAPSDLASMVAGEMQRERRDGPAYLVVTRSQLAYDHLLGARPWGSAAELQRAAARSPSFEVVIRNPDATIFKLRASGEGP